MPRCVNSHRERGPNYQSDSFRMWDFKVKVCPRTGPHDWTQCPFAHRGEKAKRRDLQHFTYSGIPCSDFEKTGRCPREDLCPQAHGVFESWLHPSRYRTKLCKEGSECTRKVCFFAHNNNELRHLEGGPFLSDGQDQLIRAFPEPYELPWRPSAHVHDGNLPFQGNIGNGNSQAAVQLGAMCNPKGNAMDLDSLSAAQLRWLAACIASMPQQPQEQRPLQLPAMSNGAITAPLQERSLSSSTLTEDDPIRADLSHGIMSSGAFLNAGQPYFNPGQMAQAGLGNGMPVNQKLRAWGSESSLGMAGMVPSLDLAGGMGPLDMPQDSHGPYPAQPTFSQSPMGNSDWSASSLAMGNLPDSYFNNSFDIDMWN